MGVSAGGLNTISPSPLRMASTITPNCRPICNSRMLFDTKSLCPETRTCSMTTFSTQLFRLAHHDQVIAGGNGRVGRRIEHHFAVAFADGQHDHAEMVFNL